LGEAGVPIEYIIRPEFQYSDDKLFWEDERRRYQMPLEGQNFKLDNKLVYKLLKAACVDTDVWAWIQKNDPSADGRKAWLAFIAHYDGCGELKQASTKSQNGAVKASLQKREGLSLRKVCHKTQGTIPSTGERQICKLFGIATGGILAPVVVEMVKQSNPSRSVSHQVGNVW
jgi:hypothetical protein